MRLIDADALKQRIAFRMWDVDDDCPHDEGTIRISEDWAIDALVDKQPTVDAVPVIRCKECKWIWTERCPDVTNRLDYDGFCSWAERGEDEN